MTDLHIGYERSTEIIKNMVQRIKQEYHPDKHVVVISGDISEIADNRGLALATLEPLSAFTILKAPGNHDYGHSGMSMRWECVRDFDDHFYGGDGRFPKIDLIGGYTFIALDSMREKFYWDFAPEIDDDTGRRTKPKDSAEGLQGCLGIAQRNALEAALEKVQGKTAVIYLHHDPIDGGMSMELLDRHRLESIVRKHKDKIAALLCGHTHDFGQDDSWGVPCYNGGTTGARDGGKPNFRVITL
jgi:3',5'-cyclic AMP phosphodiesterase CpdA